MRVIDCRYCGPDNGVPLNVVGKLRDQCGKAIFSPEVTKESNALKAATDRTADLLRVTCPHGRFRNEFLKFDMIYIFD